MLIITNKHKPKLSIRELEQSKPSALMKKYNLSEHGLQQELNKHCGDARPHEQKAVYGKVYSTDKKE